MLKKFTRFFTPLILTSLILIFITQPIFHDGLFRTMDDIQVVRIEEMFKELTSGQFPVRIAMDLGNGAGYMLFNFYSPLVYYLGAIYHFIGFTLVISTKLVFLSGFLIAWLGIYLLLKNSFDKLTATLGSPVFLVAPYLGYDAFHRGALAEFFAMCLLPLLFFSYIKLSQSRTHIYLLLSAFSTAGLIITHNLTTLITLPFLIILIILLFKKNLKIGFSAFGLGILLSSFYLLPALLEKKYIIIDQVDFITKTYSNHFLNIPQLIGLQKIPWGFLPPTLGISLFLGSIVSGIFMFRQKRIKIVTDSFISFSFISFLLSLFMASNLSKPIWEILSPVISFVQFPWRFLTLATFFGSISCAYLIYKIQFLPIKIAAAFLIILPLVFLTGNYFKPLGYNFISKYTADDPCGTAGWSNEYIPIWAKECYPKGANLELVNITAGDIKIKDLKIENRSRKYNFYTAATESGKLLLNKYYFPGWTLKIDNKESSISAALPYGLIEANIPKGNHVVNLEFKNTPIRTFANLISVLGALISLWLAYKIIRPIIKQLGDYISLTFF